MKHFFCILFTCIYVILNRTSLESAIAILKLVRLIPTSALKCSIHFSISIIQPINNNLTALPKASILNSQLLLMPQMIFHYGIPPICNPVEILK